MAEVGVRHRRRGETSWAVNMVGGCNDIIGVHHSLFVSQTHKHLSLPFSVLFHLSFNIFLPLPRSLYSDCRLHAGSVCARMHIGKQCDVSVVV